MSAPSIQGIHAAICTVTDFAAHEALFCGALGWESGPRLPLSADEAASRFQVKAPAEMRALRAPAAPSGEVWLAHFEGVAPSRLGYPPIRLNGRQRLDFNHRRQRTARQLLVKLGAFDLPGHFLLAQLAHDLGRYARHQHAWRNFHRRLDK